MMRELPLLAKAQFSFSTLDAGWHKKKKRNFLLALNSWTPQWWDPHSFYLHSEGTGCRMPEIDKDMYWCLPHHHGYRVAMEPRARMHHLRFGSSAGINEKKNV